MHAAVAQWWRDGSRVVSTAGRNRMRECWAHELATRLAIARFDKYDIREFGTENFAREGLLKQGLRLIDLFLVTIAPIFEPYDVETPFVVTPPDRPFDLRGVPDLLGRMIAPCPCCGLLLGAGVVDWKFSLSPSNYTDASHDEWVQGTCYTPAFLQRFGRFPDVVMLIKIRRNKRAPTWSIAHSTRTQHDVDALWRELDALYHDIAYEIHPATGLGSPLCSNQWCAYFQTCEPRLAAERRFLDEAGI